MKKIILNKKLLYQAYIKNKRPCDNIAKEYHCSASTIWRSLIENNIPIRTISESLKDRKTTYSKILTKDFLYQEYIVNKKSTYQIAKEVGFSPITIVNYLKINNIKPRNIKQAGLLRHGYFKILTKQFLYQEYIKNNKTMQQIAKELKCDITTVKYYLIKHDAPIRTQSEWQIGNKNGYKTGISLKSAFCIDCGRKLCKNSCYYGYKRCHKCNCEFHSGGNHWCYIKNLIREYPNKFNKILKESIRIRDNHVCQICGKSTKKNGRKMDVHHIDYIKANLNPDNLISLCRNCHCSTTSKKNRAIYIEYFKILKYITN